MSTDEALKSSNEENSVLQDLKKSGFPLEIHVGSTFSNLGWNVRHQLSSEMKMRIRRNT